MRVRRITAGGDWTFGRGKADYATNSEAIRQNVLTRLRSFTNDWFLDVQHGEEWLDVMGRRGNEADVYRTIERCVLLTPGVVAITRLAVTNLVDRHVTFELKFTDIFGVESELQEVAP